MSAVQGWCNLPVAKLMWQFSGFQFPRHVILTTTIKSHLSVVPGYVLKDENWKEI
jgi:hypothetical protein